MHLLKKKSKLQTFLDTLVKHPLAFFINLIKMCNKMYNCLSPTVTFSLTSRLYICSRSSFSDSSPNVKKAKPLPAFAAAISWIKAAQQHN